MRQGAKRIWVLLNPSSGAGRPTEVQEVVTRCLSGAGAQVRISLASQPNEVSRLACAAKAESDLVVAAGGDGTVNAVAAELVGSNVPLAVLPLGTFNHFARDLGVPVDLESACHAMLDSETERIDVGEVNGHIFLNNASLGLHPSLVCERRAIRRMGLSRPIATVLGALSVFRRFPQLRVAIQAESDVLLRSTPFVLISNNRYRAENPELGQRPRLNEGQLCLYVPRQSSRLALLRLAALAVLGQLDQGEDLTVISARRILIDARARRLRVSTDGEIRTLQTPLRFAVHSRALLVSAPRRVSREAA